MKNKLNPKASGLDNISHDDVNPHLAIPGLQESEKKKVVAEAISLDLIRVDVAQPRRAIPFAIRGGWDGSPDAIPGILRRWQQAAVNAIEQRIDTAAILNNQGTMPEPIIDPTDDKPIPFPAITQDYLELMQLAHSIKNDGQINAITVVDTGDGYMIETGERRYLASWMIRAFVGGTETINAQVMEKFDLIRQAKENTARLQLNAISMARQLARLLMHLYTIDGEDFQPFHELVQPGKSDRAYYAQVADGNKWRVKGDWKTDFLNAMNLPSSRQVSAYRSLLSIDDEMWIQADSDNWSLNAIQIKLDEAQGTNRSGQNTPDEPEIESGGLYMHVNSTDEDEGSNNPPSPTPEPQRTPAFSKTNASPFRQPQEEKAPDPVEENTFKKGDIVYTRTGHRGRVVGTSGKQVTVQTSNSIQPHNWDTLSYIHPDDAKNIEPRFPESTEEEDFDLFSPIPTEIAIGEPVQDTNGHIGKVEDIHPTKGVKVDWIEEGEHWVDKSSLELISDEKFNMAVRNATRAQSFKRFDRVDTEFGQGVITSIRGNEFVVVTISDTGKLDNRVFPAADLTRLPAAQVGNYAITSDGVIGKITRIDTDNSGLDLRIDGESPRTITRSAHDVSILYDYQPAPADPPAAPTPISDDIDHKINVAGFILQIIDHEHPALQYLGWLFNPSTPPPPGDLNQHEDKMLLALNSAFESLIGDITEHSHNTRQSLEDSR